MKLTILMLGGSRRVSMAKLLKESGKRLGYDVEIVAYELETRVPIALEGEVLHGMKFSDPHVVDDIARIVKEKDVRIILPFINSAIEIASLCKERFKDVFVPVADFATTSRMFDKSEAARLFKEAGFPIPRTYTVIDNEMPAIVKPRKGGSSRGIKIFHDVEDLMLLQDLDKYVIQEYIEHNREYSVDCYISASGEILATVPRERLEIMGGEVTRTKTCRNPHLIEMSRKVIEHFKVYIGLYERAFSDLCRNFGRKTVYFAQRFPTLFPGECRSPFAALFARRIDWFFHRPSGKKTESGNKKRRGAKCAAHGRRARVRNERRE